jgi:hypothetical protein
MMVWECTSTSYVLFWIVVVHTSDPKGMCCGMCNHVYRAKHMTDMGRLS